MATRKTTKPAAAPETKQEDKIVINQFPIIIRNTDRTQAGDVGKWWDALQAAEKVIYPNRSRLYDVYKTVEIDTHLSGIIEKRISSIINKEIRFVKDDKEEESFNTLTDSAAFRRLLRELMLQKFWGISGFEFIPGPEMQFNCIPRKHIKPEKQILITNQHDQSGMSYEGVWNIWVVGDPNDYGLLMKCAPYVIWKKGNMGDWAQYIEIFGQPFIVGKYNGYDAKTKQELYDTLQNFGGSTRMMVPNEAGLEIMDGKTSNGTGDLQNQFRQACNEELSVLVLGATETTSSSDSSGYAQSKTHAKQQDIILKADMIDMMDQLNSPAFLAICKSYGYNTEGGAFEFEQEINLGEVQAKINIIKAAAAMVPVDDDYIYETTGIPKPENYDALKAEKEKQRQLITNQPPKKTKGKDDDEPEEEELPDDKKNKIKAALHGLSFFQKLRAVFPEAR